MAMTDTVKGRYSSYKLLSEVGHGGSARVFRAQDLATKNDVAVKQLFGNRPQDREDWLREVDALNTLNNHHCPHVIQYLDHMQQHDKLFLVEEYAEQGSLLRQLKQTGPMPESRVCAFVFQILTTLHRMSQWNIIHGDLKASNLLLFEQEVVKLTDFALRSRGEPAEDAITFSNTTNNNNIDLNTGCDEEDNSSSPNTGLASTAAGRVSSTDGGSSESRFASSAIPQQQQQQQQQRARTSVGSASYSTPHSFPSTTNAHHITSSSHTTLNTDNSNSASHQHPPPRFTSSNNINNNNVKTGAVESSGDGRGGPSSSPPPPPPPPPTKLLDFRGSVYWAAPEVLAGESRMTTASDVWSVACTAIELLTGTPPYFDRSIPNATHHVLQYYYALMESSADVATAGGTDPTTDADADAKFYGSKTSGGAGGGVNQKGSTSHRADTTNSKESAAVTRGGASSCGGETGGASTQRDDERERHSSTKNTEMLHEEKEEEDEEDGERSLASQPREPVTFLMPPIPDEVHLSEECHAFLQCCLRLRPSDRPSAAQLLQHPWFLNVVVPQLLQAARDNRGVMATDDDNALLLFSTNNNNASFNNNSYANNNNNNNSSFSAGGNRFAVIEKWVELNLLSPDATRCRAWLESDALPLLVPVLTPRVMTPTYIGNVMWCFARAAERADASLATLFVDRLGATELWSVEELTSACDADHLVTIFCRCCAVQSPQTPFFSPTHPSALRFVLGLEKVKVLECVRALHQLLVDPLPSPRSPSTRPARSSTLHARKGKSPPHTSTLPLSASPSPHEGAGTGERAVRSEKSEVQKGSHSHHHHHHRNVSSNEAGEGVMGQEAARLSLSASAPLTADEHASGRGGRREGEAHEDDDDLKKKRESPGDHHSPGATAAHNTGDDDGTVKDGSAQHEAQQQEQQDQQNMLEKNKMQTELDATQRGVGEHEVKEEEEETAAGDDVDPVDGAVADEEEQEKREHARQQRVERRAQARARLLRDGGARVLCQCVEVQCKTAFLNGVAPSMEWGTMNLFLEILATVASLPGGQSLLWGFPCSEEDTNTNSDSGLMPTKAGAPASAAAVGLSVTPRGGDAAAGVGGMSINTNNNNNNTSAAVSGENLHHRLNSSTNPAPPPLNSPLSVTPRESISPTNGNSHGFPNSSPHPSSFGAAATTTNTPGLINSNGANMNNNTTNINNNNASSGSTFGNASFNGAAAANNGGATTMTNTTTGFAAAGNVSLTKEWRSSLPWMLAVQECAHHGCAAAVCLLTQYLPLATGHKTEYVEKAGMSLTATLVLVASSAKFTTDVRVRAVRSLPVLQSSSLRAARYLRDPLRCVPLLASTLKQSALHEGNKYNNINSNNSKSKNINERVSHVRDGSLQLTTAVLQVLRTLTHDKQTLAAYVGSTWVWEAVVLLVKHIAAQARQRQREKTQLATVESTQDTKRKLSDSKASGEGGGEEHAETGVSGQATEGEKEEVAKAEATVPATHKNARTHDGTGAAGSDKDDDNEGAEEEAVNLEESAASAAATLTEIVALLTQWFSEFPPAALLGMATPVGAVSRNMALSPPPPSFPPASTAAFSHANHNVMSASATAAVGLLPAGGSAPSGASSPQLPPHLQQPLSSAANTNQNFRAAYSSFAQDGAPPPLPVLLQLLRAQLTDVLTHDEVLGGRDATAQVEKTLEYFAQLDGTQASASSK